jgi:hypothetical protein
VAMDYEPQDLLIVDESAAGPARARRGRAGPF